MPGKNILVGQNVTAGQNVTVWVEMAQFMGQNKRSFTAGQKGKSVKMSPFTGQNRQSVSAR